MTEWLRHLNIFMNTGRIGVIAIKNYKVWKREVVLATNLYRLDKGCTQSFVVPF